MNNPKHHWAKPIPKPIPTKSTRLETVIFLATCALALIVVALDVFFWRP